MSRGKLVIVRHGESTWNASGKWTGWTDVDLNAKGYREGELLGEKLRDIHFDQAFVSEQIRTTQTLQAILRTQGQTNLPYERRWALNERDYGAYTGLNKWDMQKKLGEEQFDRVRRSWSEPVPSGEMLVDVYHRVVPFYQHDILPLLAQGKNVLIVSHGNAIRALIKYIERISDEDIANVEMIFGTILIYDVDENGYLIHKQQRHIYTTLPHA